MVVINGGRRKVGARVGTLDVLVPVMLFVLSNEEIAGRLFVSPLTAKTHVNRAMTKLAARDRAQLVVIAYQCGLVGPAGSAAGAG